MNKVELLKINRETPFPRIYLMSFHYKMRFQSNYYINSFFWSTVTKVLSAVLGFITVPLLLGYFGKANYGLLSIATACNGYMHLMDLGMNTGAVKFFSQWAAEGNKDRIYRVARTNITFYIIVSIINVVGLLALAFWGESLFSVTHEQFIQLRTCLYILALFSTISWVATAFNQLLVADKQFAFTMQVQSLIIVFKIGLIAITIWGRFSLTTYFFWLTLVVAIAIIPYMYKCKNDMLIDSFKPAQYWSDFKIVLVYSLSLFALSLFQVTASQSMPILISMFSNNGAETVADYRIVEVVPLFVIMLCGSFMSIFLPKTSELLVRNNTDEINAYVKKWTSLTTILVCIFCFPLILSSSIVISAYVGESYAYLDKWIVLWCAFLIIQLHCTPAYSLILATGKTKVLVWATGLVCVVSMIINAALCKAIPVGSAVIGYGTYMSILVIAYYVYYYNRYLNLSRLMLFKVFIVPVGLAVISSLLPLSLDLDISLFDTFSINDRVKYIIIFILNSLMWFGMYTILLKFFRLLPSLKDIRK